MVKVTATAKCPVCQTVIGHSKDAGRCRLFRQPEVVIAKQLWRTKHGHWKCGSRKVGGLTVMSSRIR